MQELVIKNMKTANYRDVSLNKIFDPTGTHDKCFEFQISDITAPQRTGEGKLYVCFYSLHPGKTNYPYHQHSGMEEVYYIISGTATLRTPKGEKIVSEGDVIVMPPNENGAHSLFNHSDAPVIYLDVDTVNSPELVFFPDSNKFRVMAKNFAKTYKIDSEVNHLEGE